ncbi:uncharacterized protein G2W53_019808 [Senna tora]|uniref:Uncharacterized protein n=1 Tax=Senna tora TaxID=362788 RepID=A0A834U2K0_9FABA|nr:uncharacterized protein G2W53_019808 [Senna tora]
MPLAGVSGKALGTSDATPQSREVTATPASSASSLGAMERSLMKREGRRRETARVKAKSHRSSMAWWEEEKVVVCMGEIDWR